MRDLSKAEYGMLQESMVQIYDMTGKRPDTLLVHPIVQRELGVSLSLFALEHHIELKVTNKMPVPGMAFANPIKKEPWQNG